MRFPILHPSKLFSKRTLKEDSTAGLVLGVESVPDGLAAGLLANVNPLAGLYGYMFGTVGGALFTATPLMTVQATGAMAIVVDDVNLETFDDPERALFTLAILTGIVMIAAGLLKLGSILRWVSKAVMTGFITAVGLNIVLGQLDTFTGYEAEGDNRVARAIDLLFNIGQVHWATFAVGCVTIALIVWLQRTRLGALGMVVAIVVGSALGWFLRDNGREIAQVKDISDVPNSLPLFVLPDLGSIQGLIVPAFSLAFVGLVQGAGVSAGFPNKDGTFGDPSQDFVGQGTGNLLSGFFRGMPVGGSMSASSIVDQAGAKTRQALLVTGVVMAVIILAFASLVELIAMPALAGLLIVVGVQAIKPDQVRTVYKTGPVQASVMVVTLVLTMIIPLQYAVLVGVGISIILWVGRQSNRLTIKRIEFQDDEYREIDPPATIGRNDVVVLQPYGNFFFASATTLEDRIPSVTTESTNSVVILRLRGVQDFGATTIDVIRRYAQTLDRAECRFMLVTDSERIISQLEATGAAASIGEHNLYLSDEWLGRTIRKAVHDAEDWIEANRAIDEP
ncbi:MAG: SulP family inorganic anion transporter [Ilumatobacteraceae bacterium]